jgi:phosphoglycolate phosphatase-like HAD superfamily hydrolase
LKQGAAGLFLQERIAGRAAPASGRGNRSGAGDRAELVIRDEDQSTSHLRRVGNGAAFAGRMPDRNDSGESRRCPMGYRMWCVLFSALLLAPLWSPGEGRKPEQPPSDPLPSWNGGAAKKAILDFVRATTDKASPKYIPPAERIVTFDNDGTLWVEQPLYTQVVFALERVKALAPKHPDWKTRQPFKAVLEGGREAMARFSKKDLLEILATTHAGMTVDEFRAIARSWLATAKHPRFKRLYTECVYQPMLEVMNYLRANGFRTYIVTGGGQEFVRVFSERAYGIPPEQVIGSALRTKYTYQGKRPVLLRLPLLLLLDDEEGKPEDIELFIGRKPVAAFGNSDGDRQMLEWTQSGRGTRLMMLVHNDDGQREFSYGAKSKVGTFSDSPMTEANKRGWVVISMKNDWKRIFAFEK